MPNRSNLLHSYNAAEVIMNFIGIPILGLADGTFVNVERNEDAFGLVSGSDGEGCRWSSNNRSGKVTFTLGQWAITNDLLSAVALVDELKGDGIGAFLMKDMSGRSLYSAEKAWIVKLPAAGYSRESSETREWIIETNNLIMLVGGN